MEKDRVNLMNKLSSTPLQRQPTVLVPPKIDLDRKKFKLWLPSNLTPTYEPTKNYHDGGNHYRNDFEEYKSVKSSSNYQQQDYTRAKSQLSNLEVPAAPSNQLRRKLISLDSARHRLHSVDQRKNAASRQNIVSVKQIRQRSLPALMQESPSRFNVSKQNGSGQRNKLTSVKQTNEQHSSSLPLISVSRSGSSSSLPGISVDLSVE